MDIRHAQGMRGYQDPATRSDVIPGRSFPPPGGMPPPSPEDASRAAEYATGYRATSVVAGSSVVGSIAAGSPPVVGAPSGAATQVAVEDFMDEEKVRVEFFRQHVMRRIQMSMPIVQARRSAAAAAINSYTQVSEAQGLGQASQGPAGTAWDLWTAGTGPSYQFVNVMAPLIDILQGEFSSKAPRIRCTVVNEEARNRKYRAEADLLLWKALSEAGIDAEALKSMGLPNADQLLQDFEDDISLYMERGYRDRYAALMERLLSDYIQQTRWSDRINQIRKFFLLTDCAFASPTLDPQTLEIIDPLISPLGFMVDTLCNDCFFTDSKYSLRFEYISQEEALRRYPNMTIEDLVTGAQAGASGYGLDENFLVARAGDRSYVLVTTCYFVYPKEVVVDDNVETASSISLSGARHQIDGSSIKFRYEELYFCELVGGHYVARAGIAPYQVRSLSNLAKAKVPGASLIYDYHLSPTAPSKISRLLSLQVYANRLLFEMVEQACRLNGPVISIRSSKIPTFNREPLEAARMYLRHMKSDRVLIEDDTSDPDDLMDSRPAIQVLNLDGNAGQVLQDKAAAFEMVMRQIRSMSGVSEARSGQGGQYQTSTTAQLNKTQSDFATADREAFFASFIRRYLEDIASLLKMQVSELNQRASEGDTYAARVLELLASRVGEDVYGLSDRMPWQEYGIEVELTDSDEAINREIDQVMLMAVQQRSPLSGVLTFAEVRTKTTPAAKIEAIRRLEKKQARENAAMAEQQAAMEQQMLAQADQQQSAPKGAPSA